MLDTMLHKSPMLGWLLPIPFYLMEVLTGLIQAFVFTLLSAVFVMLMCLHEEGADEFPAHGTDAGVHHH
jgi:F-type H+-transporting ATPase subunit a